MRFSRPATGPRSAAVTASIIACSVAFRATVLIWFMTIPLDTP